MLMRMLDRLFDALLERRRRREKIALDARNAMVAAESEKKRRAMWPVNREKEIRLSRRMNERWNPIPWSVACDAECQSQRGRCRPDCGCEPKEVTTLRSEYLKSVRGCRK